MLSGFTVVVSGFTVALVQGGKASALPTGTGAVIRVTRKTLPEMLGQTGVCTEE